jgi:hypothetical protein
LLLALRQVPPTLLLWATVGPSSDPIRNLLFSRLFNVVHGAPDVAATAIVAVWLILALSGAGRRPSNWLEIVGCILGYLWIVWYLLSYFLMFVTWPWLSRVWVPW